MKTRKEKTELVAFRLPRDLVKALKRISRERKVTLTGVVHDALEAARDRSQFFKRRG